MAESVNLSVGRGQEESQVIHPLLVLHAPTPCSLKEIKKHQILVLWKQVGVLKQIYLNGLVNAGNASTQKQRQFDLCESKKASHIYKDPSLTKKQKAPL